VRGAPLEQGEQQPAEPRGGHGDADDLTDRDRLDVAGGEAGGQVDAQHGDFHDPGEGSGQCAGRGAQRPGAALLDVRHGGCGDGVHLLTSSSANGVGLRR
jgi:hypothetical protein